MDVGDGTDQSPIKEMIVIGDELYVAKEQGLWLVQHADKVDPTRTNAAIPNSAKKVLSRGTTDPLVARILLQSRGLLDSKMLPQIDVALGLRNSLDLLTELDTLHRMADEYGQLVHQKNEVFLKAKAQRGAVTLPSIEDVAVRGKTFLLGADRASLAIFRLGQVFYPDLKLKKGWFAQLKTRMTKAEPEMDGYLEGIGQGLKFLRNARNAVEHAKPGQRVNFRNYELAVDGVLQAPSVEVEDSETPLSTTDLMHFLTSTNDFLTGAYEGVLAGLASIHVSAESQLAIFVVELDEQHRRYTDVRFAYASQFGDQIVPYLN